MLSRISVHINMCIYIPVPLMYSACIKHFIYTYLKKHLKAILGVLVSLWNIYPFKYFKSLLGAFRSVVFMFASIFLHVVPIVVWVIVLPLHALQLLACGLTGKRTGLFVWPSCFKLLPTYSTDNSFHISLPGTMACQLSQILKGLKSILLCMNSEN